MINYTNGREKAIKELLPMCLDNMPYPLSFVDENVLKQVALVTITDVLRHNISGLLEGNIERYVYSKADLELGEVMYVNRDKNKRRYPILFISKNMTILFGFVHITITEFNSYIVYFTDNNSNKLGGSLEYRRTLKVL